MKWRIEKKTIANIENDNEVRTLGQEKNKKNLIVTLLGTNKNENASYRINTNIFKQIC